MSNETRERLLDAAEALFADEGFRASSVRAITERAGVNIASVNYHFGSKDGLVRAVFDRRLEPLNQERMDLLEQGLAEGATVENVLHAFLAPVFQRLSHDTPRWSAFCRLMGRAMSSPQEHLQQVLAEELFPVGRRFIDALCDVHPELSRTEIVWRFKFGIGAMAHSVAMAHASEHFAQAMGAEFNPIERTDRLVTFLAAGFRAPFPAQT